MKLDFYKHEASSQLKGILIQIGLRVIYKGMDCRALDFTFS